MSILEITDDTFTSEVLECPLPVLLHFYADICKPCDDVYPLLEEASIKYDGRIAFKKINTDLYREVVTTYGIRGLPTILIFQNTIVTRAIVGSYQAQKLEEALAVLCSDVV